MRIPPIIPPQIPFGYKSVLKTYWKDGLMPSVTHDIYGDVLKRPTLEHLIPHSKGGKSDLTNYALANAESNFSRGNKTLDKFVSGETVNKYLKQFEGIKLPDFNGNSYIEGLIRTFKRMGFKL